ncbi:MAG TPA: DUF5684 domain-containing protein [Candidatus Acidoferrum sp.]|nr:DUF5684 domain-containing protein [Candidatus Acidoferrum sp.]
MKFRERLLAVMCAFAAMVLILVPTAALAQDDSRLPIAFFGAFLMVYVICLLAFYVYFALALQTIAQKTNTENPWLAWIPIVNIVLMCMIAKKPIWWIILCFIPLVNLVIFILLWMGIAEARNKPNWWGILLIVPILNIIVPGYLAWSD